MTKPKSIQLIDTYNLFLVDRQARGLTADTLQFYRNKLGGFVTWASASAHVLSLSDCTPSLLRSYLVQLQGRNLSPFTVHGAARSMRSFFRWCATERLLKESPMTSIPNPRLPKTILPALKPMEVRQMLAAASDSRAYALILVLLDTGVRASECSALRALDVDITSGEVKVQSGKGRKSRVVYMGSATRRALLRYFGTEGWPEENDALFRNERTGAPLTHSGIRQILQGVSNAAGVKNASPHAFRRTFAIEHLRAGVNIYTLARLMGHSDIQVLRQYLAIVEGDLAEAHQRAAVVDKLTRGAASGPR